MDELLFLLKKKVRLKSLKYNERRALSVFKKKTEKQYGIIILVNDPKRVKNELCSIKYD